MLGIALTLVMAQAQSAVIAPWGSFDGKSWSGIAIGTSEKDLKGQFKTGKTEISDPASVRVQSDRKDWIVSAVLTQQGGKGNVVGIAVEREKEPLDSLDNLQKELGAPDETRYPSPRFGDWSVAHWQTKGIAAVVEGNRVRKLLLATPEALATKVGLLAESQEPERADTRIEVGDMDVRPNLKMRDGTSETLAEVQMRRSAERAFERYDGRGWAPVRQGRSSIVINFSIEKKGDKEYRMQASGTLQVRSKLGEDTWVTDAQFSTERDAFAAGLRIEPMIERVFRDLGKKADDSVKRLVWQAEWRPFYGLARP